LFINRAFFCPDEIIQYQKVLPPAKKRGNAQTAFGIKTESGSSCCGIFCYLPDIYRPGDFENGPA
jgi:hypothetical protein